MAHPHSMMSAEEIDLLIHSHLVESGYAHTSFSLLHESSLALQPQPIPPGHLVRILQKGLLYLEAEARYRGDPPTPAPRLVGYPIPNALPLPPLPKHGKGKAKEEPPVKRKATSDKDDPDPKRPRTVSGGSPDVVLPRPKPTLPPVKTTASVSVSPSISRAPSPNVARKPSASTSALQPKKKSTPTVEPPKAASSSVLSAPSTPALGAAASVAASDRQSSLPKQEPVKKEEPEFKEEPCSMEGVRQFGADDPTVVRLRGHTTPKVQPCSWNAARVPALLATGGGDSTCRIWDVPAPDTTGSPKKEGLIIKDNIACKHSSAQRRADVAAVAWDPSGSLLATGSEDGIARIWTPAGDLHLVLSMHQRTIFSLKWNSLGTMLLTGSLDNSVCLWELSNGKVKQQWQTHTDSVLDVDWNDDSTFASASMDKSIHLFNISRVSPVHRFKGHRDEVNVVKFSSCGTLLASCSDDHNVRVWSLRNIPGLFLPSRLTVGEEGRLIDEEDQAGVFVLEGHRNDVHTIAWAPWSKEKGGPRLLASASFDSTARLWDADKGTCLHVFARHTDLVYSLQFSPGAGNYLATGSNDSRMCVWSMADYKLAVEYTHSGPVYEIAWHPTRAQLAICGRHEDVGIVELSSSEVTL